MIVIDTPAELDARDRVVSAFVGPAGVGKTTTIAKVAAHAAARMKKKVALISTDMLRVGGQEQLNRYGMLLGIPTYGCPDTSTLKNLVDGLADRDLILLDTPGISPSDTVRLSRLQGDLTNVGARVNLVMAATTRSEDVNQAVRQYQSFFPGRTLFTKVYETEFKSGFVGDLLRNDMALSYITNGQHVPEHLLIPGARDLAAYVLPMEPGKVQ
jgi:flagellar biosynthesis protein FlhF